MIDDLRLQEESQRFWHTEHCVCTNTLYRERTTQIELLSIKVSCIDSLFSSDSIRRIKVDTDRKNPKAFQLKQVSLPRLVKKPCAACYVENIGLYVVA